MKQFLLSGAVFLALLSMAGAQTFATFTQHTNSGPSQTSHHIPIMITADLNSDGTQDLVICCDSGQNLYYQLANGSGGFDAEQILGVASWVSTSGDFDHNGHTDVVAFNNNVVTVFLNEGSGVFKQVSFPSLGGIARAAADFNRDGNLDLLINKNLTELYFVPGNGKGGFGAPVLVDSSPNDQTGTAVLGDFDGDGNADVAMISEFCDDAHACSTAIRVLYGNGKGGFTGVNHTYSYGMLLDRANVNHDGRLDLILQAFSPGQGQFVGVLQSNAGRTFTLKLSKAASGTFLDAVTPAAADFNGDGRQDIATRYEDLPSSTEGFFVDLAGTTTTWTKQERFPIASTEALHTLAVADFNRDRKPDAVVLRYPSGDLNVFTNTTSGGSFGGCSYPGSGQSIHVCSPANGSKVSGTVHFTAAATYFNPIRKMELWVDGKKITQQFRSWLDFSATFSAGTHKATFFATGYDSDSERTTTSFTVP